jgi:hypothetical protein
MVDVEEGHGGKTSVHGKKHCTCGLGLFHMSGESQIRLEELEF